jgi:hypothetical protein
LDYLYSRVEDAALTIMSRSKTKEQLAFARQLMFVAEALRDVEWVMSGDMDDGDDIAAIMKVITPDTVLQSEIERAEAALASLHDAIKLAKQA